MRRTTSPRSRFQALSVLGFALTLAGIARAQAPAPDAGGKLDLAVASSALAADGRHDRLHFDVDASGDVWVRGRAYKASFGADGATYIPYLGPQAPRNFPVRTSLVSATLDGRPLALGAARGAVRDGDRVTIDRGPVDEVYELGLDAVEQTFVVSERVDGELRLVVSVESELGRTEGDDGFRFANEHGGVHYGRANIREEDGTLTAVATRAIDGGVEIEVPAEIVARSRFPLVIDPVLTTFAVDVSLSDDRDPDVAYDASTNHFLVVCRETYSQNDRDVYSKLLGADGTVVGGGYADFTSEDWGRPRIANLNSADQFMVVADARYVSGATTTYVIRGRQTGAASVVYGAPFTVSETGETGDKYAPDIGGDPFGSAPAFYCVVWHRGISAANSDIQARLVAPNGALVGPSTIQIDSTTWRDVDPSVSSSNGGVRWNVAWTRVMPDGDDRDVCGAQVGWNGTIDTPSFSIAPSPWDDELGPRAASPFDDGRYVVAFTQRNGHDDTVAAVCNGSVVESRTNLSVLDNPNHSTSQSLDDVDCDGKQFAVSYTEHTWTTHDDPYVSTYYVLGSVVGVAEARANLALNALYEPSVRICSTFSGGGGQRRRYMATWDRVVSPTDADVLAGLYESPVGGPVTGYCFGDGSDTACPCGNFGGTGRGCANAIQPSGAWLTRVGHADLAMDDLQLQVDGLPWTATCFFYQGNTAATPATVFGDGLLCTSGATLRLGTQSAMFGFASYPNAGDPRISVTGVIPAGGAVRVYQAWYRSTEWYCTTSLYNLTNGLRAVWLP